MFEDLDPGCRRGSGELVVEHFQNAKLRSDNLLNCPRSVQRRGWRLARSLAIVANRSGSGRSCCGAHAQSVLIKMWTAVARRRTSKMWTLHIVFHFRPPVGEGQELKRKVDTEVRESGGGNNIMQEVSAFLPVEPLSGRKRRLRWEARERVVYRHGAILLILRVRIGFGARRSRRHGGWSSGQRTGRSERESRGTRDRGRRQNKETTKDQTCDDMWMNMFYANTSCDTLSHNVMCAQGWKCREKVTCEVYLSALSVGYSGSLLTVNETNCNKKERFWAK